eukprot:g5807.t1
MFSFRSRQFVSHRLHHHSLPRHHQLKCRSHDRDIELIEFEQEILKLQESLTTASAKLDGSGLQFCHDKWHRDSSTGFGITRVLENGSILEKAAVNVSIIRGTLTPNRAATMSDRGRNVNPKGGQKYSAAALSLVFHPIHPFIPTLRADIRRFSVENEEWYGGGADLTPAYPFPEDFTEFHRYWKKLCDKYEAGLYAKLKQQCDAYFYLPARGEHRGIGGIFFDDLSPVSVPFEVADFVREIGTGFLPSWEPIVNRRRTEQYSNAERNWQLHRRSRYVEFNLLYDRGVKFGLDGGRVESIMVSAPPLVSWGYNRQPKTQSVESELQEILKSPVYWADENPQQQFNPKATVLE